MFYVKATLGVLATFAAYCLLGTVIYAMPNWLWAIVCPALMLGGVIALWRAFYNWIDRHERGER